MAGEEAEGARIKGTRAGRISLAVFQEQEQGERGPEDRLWARPHRPMEPASEAPRGWVETQAAGHPQSSCFSRRGLRTCVSTTFRDDADAAGLGTTL